MCSMSYNLVLTTPGSLSLRKSITSWDRGVPIHECMWLWCTFMRMHLHFKYSSSSACFSPTDSMGDSDPMQKLGRAKVIRACLGIFLHKKKGTVEYMYIFNWEVRGAETKKWHSLFVKDYRRQIARRSLVWGCSHKREFRTASVFCVSVHRSAYIHWDKGEFCCE